MRKCFFTMLGLGIALMVTGCQPRNQFVAPPPPKVTVAFPVERPIQDYFYTTGQTRAVASVELRARVSGYLNEIKFKDGDLVKKDQVLFIIDPAPYQAILDSNTAALQRAKAQMILAERQLARTRQLAKENAATESNLDIQEAERASTVADVAAAEAAVRQAQLNVDYTQVRAPFDGRIGRHQVDLGNLITTGDTLLASIETVHPIYAYFTLSEHDLLGFIELQKSGQITPINEADPPLFEMALGNSDNFIFKGKLDFREFGINPQTGTTDRRAVFDNKDVSLVPGLFCRIRAPVGPPRERLLVDDRAVSTDQRGNYLLVVNDKNEVELKMVAVGIIDKGLRVIESGIGPKDRVVINGLQRARPGSTVDSTEAPMVARLDNAETKSKPVSETKDKADTGNSTTDTKPGSPGDQKKAN